MTPLTQEWVDKAEGDWNALGREMRARKSPNYDDACFHAQQCAEKYLKARLVEAGRVFRKHTTLPTYSRGFSPWNPAGTSFCPACKC